MRIVSVEVLVWCLCHKLYGNTVAQVVLTAPIIYRGRPEYEASSSSMRLVETSHTSYSISIVTAHLFMICHSFLLPHVVHAV